MFDEKARQIILVKAMSMPNIEVMAGECRYNFRCQMNAVHEAVKAGDDEIAMAFAVKNAFPFIHFLNYDGRFYVDNTLGVWSKLNQYFLISHIKREDFFNIEYIFSNYRTELRKEYPWWMRPFVKETF